MNTESLKRLQKNFPDNMDAVLLTSEMHQYYITGFNLTDSYVVVTRDRAYVFTDFRFMEAAKKQIDDDAFEFLMDTQLAFVRDKCRELGIQTVGFEDKAVTVATLAWMKDVFGTDMTLVPIGNILEAQRALKSAFEMENIRQAQRIADRAFDHILGFITPDRTEAEVALELEFFMRKCGASGVSFPTIAITGAKTAIPHGEPEDRKLERGFFTMDFGCVYHGYCSDMTRTIVIGSVTEEMRRVYDTVLAAQEAVLSVIGYGKTCRDMDKVARDLIDNAGYKGRFGHSLGHGVGLYIHESPRMDDTVLTDGHVVTVEPGIYLEGQYGVRIEDMIMIHDHITEDITHSPKQLIVL